MSSDTAGACAAVILSALLPALARGAPEPAPPEGPRAETAQPAPRRCLMIPLGFYNNEDPEEFDPAPIDYAGIRLEDVWKGIQPHAESHPWSHPTEVLPAEEVLELLQRERSAEEEAGVKERALEILTFLDDLLQEDYKALERAPALRLPIAPSAGLNPDDRVLIVVGLESAKRPEGPHLLRAAFGALWFSGDGRLLFPFVRQYDFARFDSQAMVDLMKQAFEKLPEE